MGEQVSASINLTGGLNLVDPHFVLQQQPGSCSELINYELSVRGGYRRINGYTAYGTTTPTGSTDTVFAVFPYADGVIAVASTNVYFSTDGDTWVTVNRDTYVAQTGTVEVGPTDLAAVIGSGTSFTTEYEVGDHIRIDGQIRQISAITDNTNLTLETDLSGSVAASTAHYKNGTTTLNGTISSRTSQGQTMIAYYEGDDEYGSIVLTDTTGNNNAASFKITGTGGSRAYYWDDLTTADFAAPADPRYCSVFANRLIVAAAGNDNKNTIYYGDRFDIGRFDGASAGSITVEGEIVGIYPFKDVLVIFCRNSIHQLTNLDSATKADIEVKPITSRTGLAATFSVQEAGNDLIFLADDGVRTLSASEKYGDLTFGVISRKIDPLIATLLDGLLSYTISSVYIKEKNQYRLYYTTSASTSDDITALVATNRLNTLGQLEWQWSTIKGIMPSCVDATTNTYISSTEAEQAYFGGWDGQVYEHDTGSNFNGSDIDASFTLNEIDYGDIGIRKTIHYVRLFGTSEGTSDDIFLTVNYDFSDTNTMQPSSYLVNPTENLSKYGVIVYGTGVYSGRTGFNTRVNTDGSGYSNNFKFSSTGTGESYNLDSIYVDMRVGPKF